MGSVLPKRKSITKPVLEPVSSILKRVHGCEATRPANLIGGLIKDLVHVGLCSSPRTHCMFLTEKLINPCQRLWRAGACSKNAVCMFGPIAAVKPGKDDQGGHVVSALEYVPIVEQNANVQVFPRAAGQKSSPTTCGRKVPAVHPNPGWYAQLELMNLGCHFP